MIANGNTTTLADESLVFDAAGRHVSTSSGGGVSDVLVRDATDRVVASTSSEGSTSSPSRLGYSVPGDGADLTLDGSGRIVSHQLALPGGVLVSVPVGGGLSTWSYPNVHGDVILTTDGSGTRTGSYACDPFGQPVDPVTGASIPHHQLSYGFADTTACTGTAVNAMAGRNGNRTSLTDSFDGGPATTTTYCYDTADRLTSTTVTNAPADANPVVGTILDATTLTYDAHGNTTKFADQALTYDVADRHMSTTVGTTAVTYMRDQSAEALNPVGHRGDRLSAPLLWRLCEATDPAGREQLAWATTNASVLVRLASDENLRVRRAVAESSHADSLTVRRLTRDARAEVRAVVAHRHDLPPECLVELSRDRSAHVRFNLLVAHHDNAALARLLADDVDPTVRMQARAVLTISDHEGV